MQKTLFLSAALFTFVLLVPMRAYSDTGCPAMQGKFLCPAIPNQAELSFEIVQAEEPDLTRYTFHYVGFPDDEAVASPTGVVNHFPSGDTFIFCVDQSLIYVKKQNETGSLQQSFRGPNGEYIVKVRGKEVIRCLPVN